MDKIVLFKDESFQIMGACFEVYKILGNGFLESVYQESLAYEFRLRNIPFVAQPILKLSYKDLILDHNYKPDFICYNSIILELKAVSKLNDEHNFQLLNYLRATKLNLGILVNFGHFPLVEHKRIVI